MTPEEKMIQLGNAPRVVASGLTREEQADMQTRFGNKSDSSIDVSGIFRALLVTEARFGLLRAKVEEKEADTRNAAVNATLVLARTHLDTAERRQIAALGDCDTARRRVLSFEATLRAMGASEL